MFNDKIEHSFTILNIKLNLTKKNSKIISYYTLLFINKCSNTVNLYYYIPEDIPNTYISEDIFIYIL